MTSKGTVLGTRRLVLRFQRVASPRDGRVVVTRTRDGGESFDILANGLPQEHAYDVVYRHAMAIDASGNRLAFGSTTGGCG
jgi:hypothetical protein